MGSGELKMGNKSYEKKKKKGINQVDWLLLLPHGAIREADQ